MKKCFNFLFILIINFCLAFGSAPSFATTEETTSSSSQLDIKYEIKSYDTEKEVASQISQLAEAGSQNEKQTTVISADSETQIKAIYKNQTFQKIKSDTTFVVHNNALGRFTKSAVTYFKNTYQSDKIGFIIATYTTVAETLMWIHVAPLSTIEKSANIVFSIGLAIYFKLNKGRWTELTKEIKKPLQAFFNSTNEISKTQQLKYDFLANLTLAAGISLARIPMLSLNQIIDAGISLDLFKIPLLMSIIGTASFFTWSEHQGRIDRGSHPISKFIFYRAGELRSVLVATFASTAALLNPSTYGAGPWITLTVVGTAGLLVYLNGNQINNWIEKSPYLKKIETLIHHNSSGAGRCEELFVL